MDSGQSLDVICLHPGAVGVIIRRLCGILAHLAGDKGETRGRS